MARPGRLARPPIHEALVDLRIAGADGIDDALLKPLKHEFSTQYPKADIRRRFEARVQPRTDSQPDVQARDAGFHGLFLATADDSKIVQFRVDGFTLNQLRGYTSADDLFAEAIRLWRSYANVVHPVAIVRVALRYINRLLLGFSHGDSFERFLTAAPSMPDDAPQQVAEFLTRVTAYVDDPIEGTAIVTQRLEHATDQSTPYTLDTDVFREGEFGTDADTLARFLEELRQIKNRLFFSFMTDQALEPYR
jgi:uncharacterized protein (TIGR04255 family)